MLPVEILRDLVAIPSYVNGSVDERKIAEYLRHRLEPLPFLNVQAQDVGDGRSNIVVRTAGEPRILFAGHMDTVEPKQGWTMDQFAGSVDNGRLFGLGAADTKGGIASLVSALEAFEDIQGLTALFYCDEEYDFKGMRAFLAEQQEPLGELAIVIEDTNLALWRAHRGLIEIGLSIRGRTGHAANPGASRNAIRGVMSAVSYLDVWLTQFYDVDLGLPSCNVAYIHGGLELDGTPLQLGKQGNNVADFAEVVLDIRTSHPALRAEAVAMELRMLVERAGFHVVDLRIRHDLGALTSNGVPLDEVESIVQQVVGECRYLDPATKGYGDGEMLQRERGIPVVYIGPVGANTHAPDEWVSTESLDLLSEVYKRVIQTYCRVAMPP